MDPLWKDIATVWGPIAGVLIGWFLNEFGQLIRLRREDRRVLGKAITDLLDVYDSAARLRAIEKHLQSMSNPSPYNFVMIEKIFNHLADIQKRYEETVNTLSGIDPVGAYELRSKIDSLNAVYEMRKGHLSELSNSEQNKELIEAFKSFDQLHQRLQTDRLKRTIIRLAKKHGWVTWVKVKKILTASEHAESNVLTWAKALADSYENNNPKGVQK